MGGLSHDKQFLASLVNRKTLTQELVITAGEDVTRPINSDDGGLHLGASGTEVATMAKEALTSLQVC